MIDAPTLTNLAAEMRVCAEAATPGLWRLGHPSHTTDVVTPDTHPRSVERLGSRFGSGGYCRGLLSVAINTDDACEPRSDRRADAVHLVASCPANVITILDALTAANTREAEKDAEIARLTPYVEAFRREERRADVLGQERDDARADLDAMRKERDEARESEWAATDNFREEHLIVDRIWDQLGRPSYEELAGRMIYDLIDELKARATAAEASLAALRATVKTNDEVLAERRRQIEVEGWTPEHDDTHVNRELAIAAGCYATWIPNTFGVRGSEDWYDLDAPPDNWPWRRAFWRPGEGLAGRRKRLVKAGALIFAEIERLDRVAERTRALAEAKEASADGK